MRVLRQRDKGYRALDAFLLLFPMTVLLVVLLVSIVKLRCHSLVIFWARLL